VLKNNKFYIESQYPEVLRELLRNPTIRDARIIEETMEAVAESSSSSSAAAAAVMANASTSEFQEFLAPEGESKTNELFDRLHALDEDDKDSDLDDGEADEELLLFSEGVSSSQLRKKNVSFMIDQKYVQVNLVINRSSGSFCHSYNLASS
jgi:hypothetical protein